MNLKKTILFSVIASSFAYSSVALAGTTPEFSLLERVIALQGQNLSAEQVQADVHSAMTQYLATATPDGQAERMKDAMVEMGIYTPAQADSFMAAAQSAVAHVATTESTADGASHALAAEMATLAHLHPVGAQYSNCDGVDAGATILGLGAATAVVGAIIYYNNNDNGGIFDNNNSDNLELGRQLMIWGGVAAGVGLVVTIATTPECH